MSSEVLAARVPGTEAQLLATPRGDPGEQMCSHHTFFCAKSVKTKKKQQGQTLLIIKAARIILLIPIACYVYSVNAAKLQY